MCQAHWETCRLAWMLPLNRQYSGRPAAGGILFGVGWGLWSLFSVFSCFGPVGGLPLVVFFIIMVYGMVLFGMMDISDIVAKQFISRI
ncbi:MAG: hypothetical protein KTR32_27610 [Granulosicoccus sp.]|nr:hypothetical protein [Granulosicoccus sp.]